MKERKGEGKYLAQHILAWHQASVKKMMKVRQVIALLDNDGWRLVATRGSHRQYKHPRKAGRVTVAGKPGDDVAPGTLNSILKQAGLKETR